MNKTILIIAILACCLPTNVLSAESENRELAGINLGNLGNAIGGIIGAIKNNTSTTTPANNSTTPVSNSTSSTPANNNTSTTPVKNTTSPTNSTTTTPVTNNTSSIPANNTNTAPVSNNTSSTPANNNTSTTPVQNTTSPTNSSTTPVVNNTQPADPDSDAESSDTDSSTNTTNTTTPAPAPAPVKYAKNDVNMATFKDDCMKVHNQVRNDVGLNNLTWSDSLAASAQAWAENMAKNGFRHSGKTGENIASSTYSTKTLSRLLGLWTKEKNYYIVGCKYPSCSSTSAEVGHYTQMVWWSTTQVGCGFAPGYNRGYNYLCCQYYKAGNIRGQYVYPVPTA